VFFPQIFNFKTATQSQSTFQMFVFFVQLFDQGNELCAAILLHKSIGEQIWVIILIHVKITADDVCGLRDIWLHNHVFHEICSFFDLFLPSLYAFLEVLRSS